MQVAWHRKTWMDIRSCVRFEKIYDQCGPNQVVNSFEEIIFYVINVIKLFILAADDLTDIFEHHDNITFRPKNTSISESQRRLKVRSLDRQYSFNSTGLVSR